MVTFKNFVWQLFLYLISISNLPTSTKAYESAMCWQNALLVSITEALLQPMVGEEKLPQDMRPVQMMSFNFNYVCCFRNNKCIYLDAVIFLDTLKQMTYSSAKGFSKFQQGYWSY